MRKALAVVLAAGEGKRMRSAEPKMLHQIGRLPTIAHVLKALKAADVGRIAVVVAPGQDAVAQVVAAHAPGASVHVQSERRGTAHAVLAARKALEENADDVIVVFGDTPFVTADAISRLRDKLKQGASIAVGGMRPTNPNGYGRLIERNGKLVAIREERDASEAERGNRLVNLGLYAFELAEIRDAIEGLDSGNDQGELYLTDVLETIGLRSRAVTYTLKHPEEANLVNDRAQLAKAEEILRRRILDAHMRNGVTVRDPASTHIEATVEIGRDTVILPGSFLRGETKIGSDCMIGPSSDLLDTAVGDGATVEHSVGRGAVVGENVGVGPYSFLRPGTVLEEGSKVGAYCEVKNTRVGRGSKVPHLSYVGDTEIGEGANLGAGTITANFDGENKSRTSIGDGAFTGVNTNLIAPVTVGADSYTGAGSVVSKDVPPGRLAVGAPARAIKESPQSMRKRAMNDEKGD